MQQRSALRQDGAEVQTEITFLGRVGRGSDIVRYTFSANSENISANAKVPPESMRGLRESKLITVRYLPSNPAINHPAAWEWSLLSNWPAIFVLMAFMPFGLFPVRWHRQRKLLAWGGKPVAAVVTKCAADGSSFSLNYEFRTETGAAVGGSGHTKVRQELGSEIWILYLLRNSRRNHPYPVPDYIVEK